MSKNGLLNRGLHKFLKIPFFIARGIRYHAAGRFYIPKPKKFYLTVTDRCNARCVMCSFWKKKPGKEPTLDDIQRVFSNPLLDRLETVVLSGGEPTLRDDLPQVTQTILSSNRCVKYLFVVTNGLDSSVVQERVEDILGLAVCKKLKEFTVVVSMDGVGAVHDNTRGIPYAFENVSETLKRLKKLQHISPFKILINCTVMKANAGGLQEIFKFARKMDLPVAFHPLNMKISDEEVYRKEQMLSSDQLRALKDLFNGQIELRLTDAALWQDYFRMMGGRKRRLPCASPYYTVFMSSDGDLYVCAMYDQVKPFIYGNAFEESIDKIWYSKKAQETRRKVKKHICQSCENPCEASFSLNREVFYLARFVIKEQIMRMWYNKMNNGCVVAL